MRTDARALQVEGWHDPYGNLGFCAVWNMDSPWRMYDILNGINVVDYLCQRIGDFSDPDAWGFVNYLTAPTIRFTTIRRTAGITSASASVAG